MEIASIIVAFLSGALAGLIVTLALRARAIDTEVRVLHVFRLDPLKWHYGLDISDLAGVPAGTIYASLAKFEHLEIIESRVGQLMPSESRQRRQYRLAQ